MLTGKNIGIVGGSGYLGSRLAHALCAHNRVRIIDTVRSASVPGSANVSFVRCDITQPGECATALAGVQVVFHRAGRQGNLQSMRSAPEYYEVNLLGTLNVLEACVANRVERFVFDSTEFVYGTGISSPADERSPARPCSVYGATKLASEAAVAMYDAVHGLSSIILRFCRVRDAAKPDVVSQLTSRVLRGEAVTLFDGGEPAMDFVDLDDATRACIAAASSPVRNDVINIGPGRAISLNGIVDRICAASHAPAPPVTHRAPDPGQPSVEYQFGPARFWLANDKARRVLAWSAETSTEESIKATVERQLREGRLAGT